jgi:hypothetical protein
MPALELARFHPLHADQRRALALMEVDVYLRRRVALPAETAHAAVALLPGWSDTESAMPLARAIARAGGMDDAAAWSAAWRQAGQSLPDLAELRTAAAAKRALWRLMRASMKRNFSG